MSILATRGWNDLFDRNVIERLMDRVIMFFGGVPETMFWLTVLLSAAILANAIEEEVKRRRLLRRIEDLEKTLASSHVNRDEQLAA